MKRTPLKRKRATVRRHRTPRCTVARCEGKQDVRTWCIKHAEQRADRAFQKSVRERDGLCTGAGVLSRTACNGGLQAAHVVGRGNHAVRYDPQNCHALCMAHHMLVDQHGREHFKYLWCVSVIGFEAYRDLMLRADVPTKRRQSVESFFALVDLQDRGNS